MKPNILILMVDQLHYKCLGYKNHPVVRTPNLDRLKQDSVEYSRCYVQNAFCVPSRASYLTGQYLFKHRQYGFTGFLDENAPSMPAFFRDNGYITYHCGKAHLNCMADIIGFDTMVPTLPEDIVFSTDIEDNYQVYCQNNGYSYPTDQVHGGHSLPCVRERKTDMNYFKNSHVGTSNVPVEDSLENYTAEKAIGFINTCKQEPFFLHVSFDRPHVPLSPSVPYDSCYDPKSIPLPEKYTDEQLMLLPEHIRHAFKESPHSIECIKDYNIKEILAQYYGLITHIDHEVGRVLSALKDRGLYDNTIVLFYSDHGEMAGYNGLISKFSNTIFHDHIIRTPMLLKLPFQGNGGMETDVLVEAIDVFPTLAGLCGLDSSRMPLQGKNLIDCFDDKELYNDRVAFSESYCIKMVVKRDWKLIYYVNSNEGELYNVNSDPGERCNLYYNADCKEKITELKLEIVNKMSTSVSEKRKSSIRSLFDNKEARKYQMMDKMDRWNKSIQDGGGFWVVCRDKYRMVYIPFDNALTFNKIDPDNSVLNGTMNMVPSDNYDKREEMINELLDYLSVKIRPISLMSGSQSDWDNMLSSKGRGLC